MQHPFRIVKEFFVGDMQAFFLHPEGLAAAAQGTQNGQDLLRFRGLQDLAVDRAAAVVVFDPVRDLVRHAAEKLREPVFGDERTHPSAEGRVAERNINRGGCVVHRTQNVIIVRVVAETELFDGGDTADAVGSVKYRVVDLILPHNNSIPVSGKIPVSKSDIPYIIMIAQTVCKMQTAMLPKLFSENADKERPECRT